MASTNYYHSNIHTKQIKTGTAESVLWSLFMVQSDEIYPAKMQIGIYANICRQTFMSKI